MEPEIPGFDSLPSPLNEMILGYDDYRSTAALSEASKNVKNLTVRPEFWQRMAQAFNISVREPQNARTEVLQHFEQLNSSIVHHFNNQLAIPNIDRVRALNLPAQEGDPIATFLNLKQFIQDNQADLSHMQRNAVNAKDFKTISFLIDQGILPSALQIAYAISDLQLMIILRDPGYEANKEIMLDILKKLMQKWPENTKQEFFRETSYRILTGQVRTDFSNLIRKRGLFDHPSIIERQNELHHFEKEVWTLFLANNAEPYLLLSIEESREDLIALFLEKGAKVTPKMIAIAKEIGNERIIRMLESKA